MLSPAQAAWTLIVLFAPQVSGTAISEPFTVNTSESAVPASASGLPTSTSTKLKAGQPVTTNVTVKNTGSAPEAFFLDARQPTNTVLNLQALHGPDTTEPVTFNSNVPVYLVPSQTSSFIEQASTTGSTPILFDSASPAGDPDLASTAGTSATASLTANRSRRGCEHRPEMVGAFGITGGPSEPVTTSMQATTNAFDPTLTSPTGDVWEGSANTAQLANVNPVVVQPGQTGTIPVTITPTGASGTTDSGTLYVDDANYILFQRQLAQNGNEVAAIPYAYSVK